MDRFPAIDAEQAGDLLFGALAEAEQVLQPAIERLLGGGVVAVEPFEVLVGEGLVVGGFAVEVELGVLVEREAAAGVHAVAEAQARWTVSVEFTTLSNVGSVTFAPMSKGARAMNSRLGTVPVLFVGD